MLGDSMIHLKELPGWEPREPRPTPNRDQHAAFGLVGSTAVLRERLDSASVEYMASSSGRDALFLRDPDGNGLEFMGN